MSNNSSCELSFRNPIVLSLITFVTITGFQIYKNYYKNKKDNDDYNKPDIIDLLKAPLIASILTWLISNYLFESLKVSEIENVNVKPRVRFTDKKINSSLTKNSTDDSLTNIYIDQPDF